MNYAPRCASNYVEAVGYTLWVTQNALQFIDWMGFGLQLSLQWVFIVLWDISCVVHCLEFVFLIQLDCVGHRSVMGFVSHPALRGSIVPCEEVCFG